ncbi:MAG: flagellar hook capping FlgD N-terminal domain-containing protein [Candidatus Limnocylindrales bacterium]
MPFDIARVIAPTVAPRLDAGSSSGSTATGGVDTVKQSAGASDVFGLSKDDFFKLFLDQLKNQDPTSPMDDKEFLAQLAQFTMIDTLQQMQKSLGGTQLAQASALIGDQVIGTDTSGLPASGTVDRIVQDPTGLMLVLEGGALVDPASVTQVIKPASGASGTSSSSTATT